MKLGKNVIRYEYDDIANLEDEQDQGKEFILELKGIYHAVRNSMEESGVYTLFLILGTLQWNE